MAHLQHPELTWQHDPQFDPAIEDSLIVNSSLGELAPVDWSHLASQRPQVPGYGLDDSLTNTVGLPEHTAATDFSGRETGGDWGNGGYESPTDHGGSDCPSCGGSGYDNGGEQGRTCPSCGGSGHYGARLGAYEVTYPDGDPSTPPLDHDTAQELDDDYTHLHQVPKLGFSYQADQTPVKKAPVKKAPAERALKPAPANPSNPPAYDPQGVNFDVTPIARDKVKTPEHAMFQPGTSPTGVSNPQATHFESLEESHQERIINHLHKNSPDPENPLTIKKNDRQPGQHPLEPMVNHIINEYHKGNEHPEVAAKSATWYPRVHTVLHNMSQSTGHDVHHLAGATAAMSPNLDFESNMQGIHYLAHHLSKNHDHQNRFDSSHIPTGGSLAERKQQNSDRRAAKKHGIVQGESFKQMTPTKAAVALKLQARYTDKLTNVNGEKTKKGEARKTTMGFDGNIHKAVKILGTDVSGHESKDPDSIISGHKTRSFTNNMQDPYNKHGQSDITTDIHHIGVCTGAKWGSKAQSLKRMFVGGNNAAANRQNNTLGAYSAFASATREAHRRLVDSKHMSPDSAPSDLQAHVWDSFRNRTKGMSSDPEKGFRLTSALWEMTSWFGLAPYTAASGDVEGVSQHEMLDPNGGPDEPDPDIFPEENEKWLREHDPEHPDYEGGAPQSEDPLPDVTALWTMATWDHLAMSLEEARETKEAILEEVMAQVGEPYHFGGGAPNPSPEDQRAMEEYRQNTNPADTGWAAGPAEPDFSEVPNPALGQGQGMGTYGSRPFVGHTFGVAPPPLPPPPLHSEPPSLHSASQGPPAGPSGLPAGVEAPAWLAGGAGGSRANTAPTKGDSDIARMAEAYLKVGMAAFSQAEQTELIDEHLGGSRAGNLGSLSIGDTHYAQIADEELDDLLY